MPSNIFGFSNSRLNQHEVPQYPLRNLTQNYSITQNYNINCVVPTGSKRHFSFLQDTQKRDFKCLSFLSSLAKITNNSTPEY